jgi:transketolase
MGHQEKENRHGHDIPAFISAVAEAKTIYEKPTVIIAHTIPGRGVDYMEGRYEWHGSPPGQLEVDGAPRKGEQAKEAIKSIRTLGGNIKCGHSE